MPFSQLMLFHIPSIVLGIIIIASFVLLSVVGLLLVRHFIPHQRLKVHNDVAGAIFGTLGMAYTVLLAFVVVIVWQAFDASSANVEREANSLSALYRNCESFSEPYRSKIRSLLIEYRDAVVHDEWKALAGGVSSPKVTKIMDALMTTYAQYTPRTPGEQIFFQESVHRLDALFDLRNDRVVASRTGIHPLLWFVLLFGGITTISFVFFFGLEDLKAQISMTILLASLIGLILLTILVFDFPFTGDVSISDQPFRQIILN